MAVLTWTDQVNGASLLTMRTDYNAFNTSSKTQVNLNTTNISTNATNIGLNDVDIAALDGRVTVNEGDIVDLKAPDFVQFVPQAIPLAHVEGQVYYDGVKHTQVLQGPFVGVEVRPGHGMHTHVINNSGVLIEKGDAVRHAGVSGSGTPQVTLALADSFVNARIFGIAAHDIINTAEGAISTFGEIEDLDTSLLPTGVPLYLSDTLPGKYSTTAPDIVSRVGGCLVQDAVNGVLFVDIINNTNIPTVFGGLQGQLDTGLGIGVYNLTTTAQDIGDYETETEVVVGVDALTGQITLPNDGGYRMNLTAAMSFTSLATTRNVTFELYDVTNTVIHFPYVKNIPRDATEDSVSFSWPLQELAANVHKIRIKSSVAMTVTLDHISFDMESVSIR